MAIWEVSYDYRMVGCAEVEADTMDAAKQLVEDMFLSGEIGTGKDEDCAEYEIYQPKLVSNETEEETE